MRAILIYSGGLDSTTLLYEYKDSIELAVSFDYGAKHNSLLPASTASCWAFRTASYPLTSSESISGATFSSPEVTSQKAIMPRTI